MKISIILMAVLVIFSLCFNYSDANTKNSSNQRHEIELDTTFLEVSNDIVTYRYIIRLGSSDYSQDANTDTFYTNSFISFYDDNRYYYKRYNDSCYYIIIRNFNLPFKIDTLLCNCYLQNEDILKNINNFSVHLKNKLYIFLDFDSFTYNQIEVTTDQNKIANPINVDKVIYNTIITRTNKNCKLDTVNIISNSYFASFSLDKTQLLVSTYDTNQEDLISKSFAYYNVNLDSIISPTFQKVGDRIYPAQIDLDSPIYYLFVDSISTNIYSYNIIDRVEKRLTSFNSNTLYGFELFSDSINCYLNNYPHKNEVKTIYLKKF